MKNNIKPLITANSTFYRKIKNTTYEVNIYFSKTSRETINDKIIRLIRNEVAS